MSAPCGRRRFLLFLVLAFSFPSFAAEPPVRLLLSFGSDWGDPDEPPLAHAEQDAQRVRDLFTELGDVDPARALLLQRASAAKVRERLAELQGRVAELKSSGRRVELFVFASAHGQGGALHLAGSHLALSELRDLLHRCGADLAITIVDACESGLARNKGARKGPAYALTVEPPAAKGEVFIASSGASEAAQEWDILSGSLFTHHLLTGLRGDADVDDDGTITLMEAYGYAERRTVANSVDRGQHPEFQLALEGGHDAVLTRPSQSRGKVVLDETLEGRFVLASQPRADVVTEILKQRGKVVTLAVPAGRYVLRQARGFTVALQELELPYGGTTRVDPRRFVTRDYSEVALKGGEVGIHPHALHLAGAVLSPPLEGTPARWSVGLGYRFTVGRFWASLDGGWGQARYRGVDLTTREHRFTARLSSGARFWLGPVTLMPGLAVETSWLRQDSVRDDEARIAHSYPPLPVRVTTGVAVGPQLRAELPLAGPCFVALAVTGWLRFLPVASGSSFSPGVDGTGFVGVRF